MLRIGVRMDQWQDHPLFKRAVSFAQTSQAEIEKVTKELPKLAADVARHVPFAEDAVAAFHAALDPEVPSAQRMMIWGPLLYFVLPLDAVPDFIPLAGFADDGAVIAVMLTAIGKAITSAHRAKARVLLGLPQVQS
jgi:uncharacterized membrane protein YkvA (DUF1232 family)